MPWECEHGHVHGISPDPCWTCQLEQSSRELNDENESLRQQLREADEQCHQQVADAVRSREEAIRQYDEQFARAERNYEKWIDAQSVARRLFDWLDYEETSPMTRGEFLRNLAKANQWLMDPE